MTEKLKVEVTLGSYNVIATTDDQLLAAEITSQICRHQVESPKSAQEILNDQLAAEASEAKSVARSAKWAQERAEKALADLKETLNGAAEDK